MAASVEYRQQQRSFGMVMKEKDDDLALFLQMRSREQEKNNLLLLQSSYDFDDRFGSEQDNALISKITSTRHASKGQADEFLNSENDRSDYDWLLTPPGTPLFPSLEMEPRKTAMSQIGISNGHRAVPNSTLANSHAEHASRNNGTSRHPVLSTVLNSSIAANRRPSSSGKRPSTTSRPATPAGRATLPATTKPSRPSTPTSRATLPPTAMPLRPSSPTSRATLPSTKPAAPSLRSSTPTRTVVRSSTPTARPSMPAGSKSISRSATPTLCQSTPSRVTNTSDPAGRSSSVAKSVPKTMKNPVPSRGASPTVKSRPSKPCVMPGFSYDAPPNLKTSVPERPASASRGRPGASSARSSSIETSSNGRPRPQSCSPSRGQAPNGRAHSIGSDDLTTALMGPKMVERVVNLRKLAPRKEDDHISKSNTSSGKSLSSQENLGFGRTLSKCSFDMALKHKDIRRSIPGYLRPLVTNVPASAVYSMRSGSAKSRTVSVSDSPLATSSTASSEPSVNYTPHFLDGSEVESHDLGNERRRFSSGFPQYR